MDDVSAPVARHRADGPPDQRSSAGAALPMPSAPGGAGGAGGAGPAGSAPVGAVAAVAVDDRAAGLARFLAEARERSLATAEPGSRHRRRGAARRVGVDVAGAPGSAWRVGRSHQPRARVGSRRLIPVVAAVLALVVVGWVVERRSSPVAASAATLSAPVGTAPGGSALPETAATTASSTAASGPGGRAVPSPALVPAPPAAAGDPTVGLGAPLVVAAVPPTAGAGAVVVAVASTGTTSVASSVVTVTPLAAPGGPSSHRATPPGWAALVGRLLRARSEAFAAGRPDLLVRADAEGSGVLAADRSLFSEQVTGRGFDRVVGLTFGLTSVRPLSIGPGRARVQVTGRQSACELVGSSERRSVPAGPNRRLTVELVRTASSGRWALAASWPS